MSSSRPITSTTPTTPPPPSPTATSTSRDNAFSTASEAGEPRAQRARNFPFDPHPPILEILLGINWRGSNEQVLGLGNGGGDRFGHHGGGGKCRVEVEPPLPAAKAVARQSREARP